MIITRARVGASWSCRERDILLIPLSWFLLICANQDTCSLALIFLKDALISLKNMLRGDLTVGVALRGHPSHHPMRCQTTGGHGGPPLQLGRTDPIHPNIDLFTRSNASCR